LRCTGRLVLLAGALVLSGAAFPAAPAPKGPGPEEKAGGSAVTPGGGIPTSVGKLSEEERQRLLEAGKLREFPPCPWEKAQTHKTAHYHLVHNITEPTAQYVAALLETMFAHYHNFLGKAPAQKMNVFIFASRKDFVEQAKRVGAPLHDDSGGFCLTHSDPKKTGVYCPWVRQSTVEPTGVLRHEGFHLFWRGVFGGSEPLWLNEGLAVYFENCRFDGEALHDGYISPYRLHCLQTAFRRGTNLDLAALCRVDQKGFSFQTYCEAWGFVYWMFWGRETRAQNEERQRRLAQCVAALAGVKKPAAEAFAQQSGLNLKQAEEEWKKWMLTLNPRENFGGKNDPRQQP